MYDTFGKVRNGDFSNRANGTPNLLQDTLRGFTGHNHVDNVWLIHMDGRMYDYQLGGFLSGDPAIRPMTIWRRCPQGGAQAAVS